MSGVPSLHVVQFAQAALATDVRAPREVNVPPEERAVDQSAETDPDRDADGHGAEHQHRNPHRETRKQEREELHEPGVGEHLDLAG